MNLHICTISMRDEYLEVISESIPKDNKVIWHIARSNSNPISDPSLLNNKRIRIHNITCDDSDTSFKMNYIFQEIISKDPDSYFCILDDDTLFHPRMHKVFKKYSKMGGKYMVIGKQEDKNGHIRLPSTLPHECAIDAGNVLCHSHVLLPERWSDKHWDDKFHADFDFWNRCYKHFRLNYTYLIQEVISTYNLFSNKPDTLEYAR